VLHHARDGSHEAVVAEAMRKALQLSVVRASPDERRDSSYDDDPNDQSLDQRSTDQEGQTSA
jgi:hypothetical protein